MISVKSASTGRPPTARGGWAGQALLPEGTNCVEGNTGRFKPLP